MSSGPPADCGTLPPTPGQGLAEGQPAQHPPVGQYPYPYPYPPAGHMTNSAPEQAPQDPNAPAGTQSNPPPAGHYPYPYPYPYPPAGHYPYPPQAPPTQNSENSGQQADPIAPATQTNPPPAHMTNSQGPPPGQYPGYPYPYPYPYPPPGQYPGYPPPQQQLPATPADPNAPATQTNPPPAHMTNSQGPPPGQYPGYPPQQPGYPPYPYPPPGQYPGYPQPGHPAPDMTNSHGQYPAHPAPVAAAPADPQVARTASKPLPPPKPKSGAPSGAPKPSSSSGSSAPSSHQSSPSASASSSSGQTIKNSKGKMSSGTRHTLQRAINDPNEKKKVKRAFDKMDKDKSGQLDKQEFIAFLASLFPETTPEKAEQIYREVDVNGDGGISFDEFVTYLKGLKTSSGKVSVSKDETKVKKKGFSGKLARTGSKVKRKVKDGVEDLGDSIAEIDLSAVGDALSDFGDALGDGGGGDGGGCGGGGCGGGGCGG